MIRTIIIDDEQNCIDSLAFDLRKHCPAIEIVDTCISSKQGIHSIKNHHPELVFLDVQMPWMTGFEMLDMLGKIDFAIIFTTAYDQFASKAFRLSAIDYLLKPIDEEELSFAITKFKNQLQKRSVSALDFELIKKMLLGTENKEFKKRFSVKIGWAVEIYFSG